MATESIIADPSPLQTEHVPSKFIDREDEREQLDELLGEEWSGNLFVTGSRATGKTHLLLQQLNTLPETANTCYIPGKRCNTQYKALKQLYQVVTGENIGSGHHTSTLLHKIEEQTTQLQTVVVIDDIEFLLQNDGNSLLYKLSRTNRQNLNLIPVSSQYGNLSNKVEERTYSSLQPRRIEFQPYTGKQIFQILRQRARDSLKPRSIHHEALSYIASTTQNPSLALNWLETAAENADHYISEQTVKENTTTAYQSYIDQLLQEFTEHHRLLHQSILELKEEQTPPHNTGTIYKRYENLCQTYSNQPVSNRRISTFLKHLELLDIIEAEYHYGGKKGKTREITLKQPLST